MLRVVLLELRKHSVFRIIVPVCMRLPEAHFVVFIQLFLRKGVMPDDVPRRIDKNNHTSPSV